MATYRGSYAVHASGGNNALRLEPKSRRATASVDATRADPDALNAGGEGDSRAAWGNGRLRLTTARLGQTGPA
jgi:hypothetical protein